MVAEVEFFVLVAGTEGRLKIKMKKEKKSDSRPKKSSLFLFLSELVPFFLARRFFSSDVVVVIGF